MKIKLDKFGRIVVPKSLREALGLEPGDELELTITDDERGRRCLTLTPRHEDKLFSRRGNVLVFEGKLTNLDIDVIEHISKTRDERIRKLSGRD